ncbi:gp54 [Sphingomonas phage PAU]|uniref:gp54 n=1 Tax=Sphingomonas phage PAU TaxID=1150991 RepID=UPI000257313B|nr:gp54 [Sphingomonas phage PAU]AFF28052.1 gp54 [Sphingomonas phage PAU]
MKYFKDWNKETKEFEKFEKEFDQSLVRKEKEVKTKTDDSISSDDYEMNTFSRNERIEEDSFDGMFSGKYSKDNC